MLNDWLRVVCYLQDPPWLADRKLHQLRGLAARMTESLWGYTLTQALGSAEKKKKQREGGGLKVLGEVDIPEDISNLLGKGPKCGVEPAVPSQELVALNWGVANKAGNENRERCLLEGLDCLLSCPTNTGGSGNSALQGVVTYFRDNELCLLQSDKEGGFRQRNSANFALELLKKAGTSEDVARSTPGRTSNASQGSCMKSP
ncbi:hypothetical protein HPB47_004937 [Ixodes persulcatus]|uniref:Uncharacterized protein n=1 Tax=Ixodes persulcatus TaxID=34615 RepID=A0AC60PEC3_IXOPE|nr:hypothetical protein HPB47_004937 [Ixodes persulcatus]